MPRKATVSARLMHHRLGHPSDEAIEHLTEASRDTRVAGKMEEVCEVCRLSKAHKVVSRRTPDPASYPFQKAHFDLITHKPAYNSDHFILHFIDSYSNYHKVYTFPDKGAINTAIMYFVNWVKNTFKLDIQVLQADGEKATAVPFILFSLTLLCPSFYFRLPCCVLLVRPHGDLRSRRR